MTTAQAATVRQCLATITRGKVWIIGMDALRPSTGTSNWVPMHTTQLLMNTLAIEGEEGYNAELLPRIVASYERVLQDGLLRDGASFEGMGHNNGFEFQMLLALARRGSNLFAAQTVR